MNKENVKKEMDSLRVELFDAMSEQWTFHAKPRRIDSIQWTRQEMEILRIKKELRELQAALDRLVDVRDYPVFGD